MSRATPDGYELDRCPRDEEHRPHFDSRPEDEAKVWCDGIGWDAVTRPPSPVPPDPVADEIRAGIASLNAALAAAAARRRGQGWAQRDPSGSPID